MGDQVIDPKPDQDPPPSNDNVPGWISGVPDEFKERDEVKGHKTVGGFVKESLDDRAAHAELKTKVETAIFKPGENATDEEKLTFRTSMGVPEKSEGYEIPKDEGVEHSEELITWFRTIAHQMGLSQEQVTGLVPAWDAFIMSMDNTRIEDQKKAKADAETSLRTLWGTSFDENMEYTRRGFEHFIGNDERFKGFLDEEGRGNHPLLFELIHKFGRAIGDDWSPSSSASFNKQEIKDRFTYDKSPDPPKKE